MDRFLKTSSSEATQAKEEVELLQQKMKTMNEVVAVLQTQLNDEKEKYALLLTKTSTWKEKVKTLTQSDRARIAELESQLAAYHVAREANGGELTPEIRAAVQASLGEIMAKHAEDMDACKQQVSALQTTLSTKEIEIAELMQELEAVKAIHLESQQRFAEEMQSLTDHQEKEVAQLRCNADSLQELDELKSRFREQQSQIFLLENHSQQSEQMISALQKDLSSSTEKNQLLSGEVRTLQESLATLKQKQAIWKEKVMQMKAKDDEAIKQLKSELALTRESSLERNRSPSPRVRPLPDFQPRTSHAEATLNSEDTSASTLPPSSPEEHVYKLPLHFEDEPITPQQFQEKLDTWKYKVTQQKMHDIRKIETLQSECEQLRHQLAAGADEQAQERDTLRAQLAAAERDRDNAVQQAQQHAEDAVWAREELESKATQLEQLETSVVMWKEKVKKAKLQDSERILSLNQEMEAWQREFRKVSESVLMLCAGGSCGTSEGTPTEWAETLCQVVKGAQGALICLSVDLGTEGSWAGIQSLKEQGLAALHARASAAKEAAVRLEALEDDVLRLKELETSLSARCEGAEEHARNVEENLKRASTQAERVPQLEQETNELRTRCDLLRKELQRQREAMQPERSQLYETARSEATASSATENVGAVQSALLAAAGCVSERDVVTFVGHRSLQDGSVKLSKAAAEQLRKENTELKRENAHNNTVIAQYIRELEGYKANERVQLSIEYLRNIVHQYLCAAEDLRPKMIPAICTVLEFSSKQKEDVQAANVRCPQFH